MAMSLAQMMAEAEEAAPRLEHAAAVEMIAGGGVLVVDVRDAAEVQASGKVKGALNVPRGVLEFRADPASPLHLEEFDPARPVLLYCGSGGRAALAGRTLKQMGFETVYNMGGFKAWVEAGGEIEEG